MGPPARRDVGAGLPRPANRIRPVFLETKTSAGTGPTLLR